MVEHVNRRAEQDIDEAPRDLSCPFVVVGGARTVGGLNALVEALRSIEIVLREHDVAPPALTTDGARSVLKRLTQAAEIDVDEGYLQPTGAAVG